MDNTNETCIGCGLVPVIEVNERKLCGNCFLLGMSVSLRPQDHPGTPSPHLEDLQSTLISAIDEIKRLRDQVEALASENAQLRNDEK